MPACHQEPEAALAESDFVVSLYGPMRKRRARSCSQIDLRASAPRQLMMAGNEIRMQMGFDNMRNGNVALAGGSEIEIHITLRIDHRRRSVRADQIGCLRQTPEIELLEDHTWLSGRTFGGVLGLRDHAQVRLDRLKTFRVFLAGFFVGNRSRDDHVIALL